jgi:hypothetical protein
MMIPWKQGHYMLIRCIRTREHGYVVCPKWHSGYGVLGRLRILVSPICEALQTMNVDRNGQALITRLTSHRQQVKAASETLKERGRGRLEAGSPSPSGKSRGGSLKVVCLAFMRPAGGANISPWAVTHHAVTNLHLGRCPASRQ